MTKMIINLDSEYDKKLEILKANKEFSTKSETAVKVIQTFFDKNIELSSSGVNKMVKLETKLTEQEQKELEEELGFLREHLKEIEEKLDY